MEDGVSAVDSYLTSRYSVHAHAHDMLHACFE